VDLSYFELSTKWTECIDQEWLEKLEKRMGKLLGWGLKTHNCMLLSAFTILLYIYTLPITIEKSDRRYIPVSIHKPNDHGTNIHQHHFHSSWLISLPVWLISSSVLMRTRTLIACQWFSLSLQLSHTAVYKRLRLLNQKLSMNC